MSCVLPSCLVSCLVACLSVGANLPRQQQASIRLEGIPAQLVLPVAAGQNPVIQATILNATARRVWLATSKGAARKLALSGSAAKWQINLADPRVLALAAAAPLRKLRVFAMLELPAGQQARTIASTAISFRIDFEAQPVRVFLCMGDKRLRLAKKSNWIGLTKLTALELTSLGSLEGLAADLVIGPEKYVFGASKDKQRLRLAMTAKIKEQLQLAQQARVVFSRFGLLAAPLTLRVIPSPLARAEKATRFRLIQRSATDVPKTNGWLKLSIDDVTGGQVLVRLESAEGQIFAQDLSMRQGDELIFKQGGERYSLVLDKLYNEIFGSGDYGEFLLEPYRKAHGERREQQRLIRDLILQLFEEPGLRFVRGSKKYTARQAWQHLHRKLAVHPVSTVEAFIREIASRSSTTHKPYKVMLKSGEVLEAETWWRKRLAAVRQTH